MFSYRTVISPGVKCFLWKWICSAQISASHETARQKIKKLPYWLTLKLLICHCGKPQCTHTTQYKSTVYMGHKELVLLLAMLRLFNIHQWIRCSGGSNRVWESSSIVFRGGCIPCDRFHSHSQFENILLLTSPFKPCSGLRCPMAMADVAL